MAAHCVLPWAHPLAVAQALFAQCETHDAFAFLYSGQRTSYSGGYSVIGMHPLEIRRGTDWKALATCFADAGQDWPHRWIGALAYEFGGQDVSREGYFSVPPMFMARYRTVFVFDHEDATLTRYGEPVDFTLQPAQAYRAPPVTHFAANMGRENYLDAIAQTIESIRAGNFYQANITRKFYGEFASPPCPFDLFAQLATHNPAPYSAFLKCGDTYLLSSSPERFLAFEPSGHVSTRPIKGSAARSGVDDQQEIQALQTSAKDRAENLMIVDLMRNDLSRACMPGSVEVKELCAVDSFATIHHLSSEVTGQWHGTDPLSLVEACFPPGSMTGAPKRAAIRWCENLEERPRGNYSGALGWLGRNEGDLSVVIRTLLLNGTQFEFQTGGGIVADSTPEAEWRESIQKACAIGKVCGLESKQLQAV